MRTAVNRAQAPKNPRHSSRPAENVNRRRPRKSGAVRGHVLGPALMDILLVSVCGIIAYQLRFSHISLP
jgi:hypothetical protein